MELRRRVSTAFALVLLGGAAGCGDGSAPVAAPAPPTHPCSPQASLDGFSDALDKQTYQGSYVGNLSALAFDPSGALEALSDRSLLFTLDPKTYQPLSVVTLRDERGQPLDSEGLVIDRDGSRLVSSEIEPAVRRYGPDGTLLGSLTVPGVLQVAPNGRGQQNRELEGLTLQPNGRTLVASMEGPLTGDQPNLVRFQSWLRGESGQYLPAAQWGYPVDPGAGVSEVLGIGNDQLLVLERGYVPQVGNTVKIYLADFSRATDVIAVANLAPAPDVKLATKTPIVDLAACPPLGATAKEPQANPLLDNVEGMTLLSQDEDGTLHLLLVSDDNHRPTQTTRLYRLTVRLPAG